MNVGRRGDGIWIETVAEGKYRLHWRDGSKQKSKTIRGTYDEAVALKTIGLEKLGKIKPTDKTFDDLAIEYLKLAAGEKGFITKQSLIKQLCKEFGGQRISSITLLQIEQYQARLKAIKKPATVNHYIIQIKDMIKKAVRWRMVGKEVLDQLGDVKLLKCENERTRFLSKDETASLLNVVRGSKYPKLLYPLTQIALNTGMRKSEIIHLNWDDVDFVHGMVSLKTSKNGKGRSVPLNDNAKQAFKAIPRDINGGRVFTGAMKISNPFYRQFDRAVRLAGIRDFHFHDLRHTFASNLVMAGIDLYVVSKLMGHRDIKSTQRYAHLRPDFLCSAVKALDVKVTELERQVL